MGTAVYYTQYTGADLGHMAIDIGGGLLNALAVNAGTIGILIVVALIFVLLTDFLTGVFGIFNVFRR